MIEDIKAGGAISLRAIAAGLNARGIASPNGGQWHANSVRRCRSTLRERELTATGSSRVNTSKVGGRPSVLADDLFKMALDADKVKILTRLLERCCRRCPKIHSVSMWVH
jgi:hypothetical protein